MGQSHISAFGGNPVSFSTPFHYPSLTDYTDFATKKEVLLFGESAGALNAFIISTLPNATSLMNAAISESGYGPQLADAATVNTIGHNYTTRLNCSTTDVSTHFLFLASGAIQLTNCMPGHLPQITLDFGIISSGTRRPVCSYLQQPQSFLLRAPTAHRRCYNSHSTLGRRPKSSHALRHQRRRRRPLCTRHLSNTLHHPRKLHLFPHLELRPRSIPRRQTIPFDPAGFQLHSLSSIRSYHGNHDRSMASLPCLPNNA